MIQRVYIAGPISGLREEEYCRNFLTAQNAIEAMGLIAQNPVRLIQDINASRKAEGKPLWNDTENREDIMRACVRALLRCDALLLLPGWERSKGAKIELATAEMFEMPVFHTLKKLQSTIKNNHDNRRIHNKSKRFSIAGLCSGILR